MVVGVTGVTLVEQRRRGRSVPGKTAVYYYIILANVFRLSADTPWGMRIWGGARAVEEEEGGVCLGGAGGRIRICKGNRGREFGGMRFVGPSLDFSSIPLFSKFDSDDDKSLFYTSVLAKEPPVGNH